MENVSASVNNDPIEETDMDASRFYMLTKIDEEYQNYEAPKYNGVKVINEMLVDDYGYPSFVVINKESEDWAKMIELITSIITSSPYSEMFEIHTHNSNIKGACFIRLNEANFNRYFADLKTGMHRFIEISESYFFDGLDYLASQLEDIYNFDHKDKK